MAFRQLCFGIIATIFTFNTCYGSITIEKFPFELEKFYYNSDTHALFVGAHTTPGTDYRTMSVSYAEAGALSFTGITPETVTLNEVANQPNPLFGAVVEQLSFADKNPLVVTQAEKNIIYLLKYYTSSSMLVYKSLPVLDANNAISQGVITLEGSANDDIFGYLALPNTGNFGDSGSIFCVQKFAPIQDLSDPKKLHWDFITLLNGRVEKTTPALKVGADLTLIGSTPTLHMAESFIPYADKDARKETLAHFYTGISATGGPGAADGVRGVMLNSGMSMAPDAALEANSIIGGIGSNTEVHINHLNTLYTSTQLRYLVVAGGVGTATDTARTVYALPITIVGVLAKKTALPVNVYVSGDHLWYRFFGDAATTAGDLYSPNNTADIQRARVGGQSTLPGDITSLSASKDTVFVTINSNNIPELGGVFSSQALFDATGCIQGWTNWRRVNGLTEPTPFAAIDVNNGNLWAALHDNQNILNTVVRTSWNQSAAFASSVTSLFKDQLPGMQGLVDFPREHPAFSQTVTNRISVIAATGYNRIALIESGADLLATGYFTPTQALTHTHISTNGSIGTLATDTDSIVVSGGMLAGLGGIITAAIVSDAEYSWFVVGGNGGVAILARPDGSGWPVGSLGANFSGLPADAAFKVIGNFKDVRKIVADGANLSILTETDCRRFTVSPVAVANAQAGQELGTLLISRTELETLFGGATKLSDLIVSGPVGLIGTSRGLIRVGNNRSIALDDYSTLNWQVVPLPESVGPVTRFYVIGPTNMTNDWATGICGGNVYVLNGYVGKAQTRVYRLAITGSTTTISDNTVTLFADHFVKSVNPSFYVSRGDYRNYLAYDGTLFYFMRSHFYPYPSTDGHAQLEAMTPLLRAGVGFVEQNAPRLVDATGLSMGPLVRRSAQGSMMTGGSNMYTNE